MANPMNDGRLEMLFDALGGDPAGTAARQEARGQAELVNSIKMPIQGPEDWELLSAWGVVKGEAIDDLFCTASFPPGWHKRSTNNSLWTDLVDDRGVCRGMMFYKATFHDRDAFLRIPKSRFKVTTVKYQEPAASQGARCASAILDIGLGRIVERLDPVFMAHTPDLTLGAIRGDTFYYNVVEGERKFRDSAPATGAVKIHMDVFYERFHNRTIGNYPILDAADRLDEIAIAETLKKYPSGDDVWGAEYDFPEVAIA